MGTHFEESAGSRRSTCPATKSWSLGQAIWLVVLLAHLGLTTAQAAPEVSAWGDNSHGQTDVPSGLSNVVAIAAGSSHSLALTAEGHVVAWGEYYNGSSYNKPIYVPATVPSGLSNVAAIAAGNDYSLALTTEGRVVAWVRRGRGPGKT